MLAQPVMAVVFAPGETISQGSLIKADGRRNAYVRISDMANTS